MTVEVCLDTVSRILLKISVPEGIIILVVHAFREMSDIEFFRRRGHQRTGLPVNLRACVMWDFTFNLIGLFIEEHRTEIEFLPGRSFAGGPVQRLTHAAPDTSTGEPVAPGACVLKVMIRPYHQPSAQS